MKNKILLVEDEHPISNALKILLEDIFEDRIEITQAFTGINALNILKESSENSFSICLLDLMVVQLSGYELLNEIQRDPYLKDIEIIVISAAPNANAFGLQKNVPVVKKPIHIKELVDLIEEKLKTGTDLSSVPPLDNADK